MNCSVCGCTIPDERLEALPNTTTCVNCSGVKKRIGFMDYGHKTASEFIQIDPDDTEGLRRATRYNKRDR